jgi:DNA adenine methylase
MNKPFLKWAGGKGQILSGVLSYFPPVIRNYYEPFLGGGSVLIGLLEQLESGKTNLTGEIIVGDLNQVLILCYRHIQNRVESVISELDGMVKAYNEAPPFVKGDSRRGVNQVCATQEEAQARDQAEVYYYYRHLFNGLKKTLVVGSEGESTSETQLLHRDRLSALLILLNKTCFRGLYREGSGAKFNVPFGHYKSPQIYSADSLRQLSLLFKKYQVQFLCQDFSSYGPLEEGDFAYLDSPYYPEKKDSFLDYTSDGFGPLKHAQLVEWCQEVVSGGGRFLQSNAAVPYIHEAYSSYTIHPVECRRAIHSKKPGSTTTELLIKGGPYGTAVEATSPLKGT